MGVQLSGSSVNQEIGCKWSSDHKIFTYCTYMQQQNFTIITTNLYTGRWSSVFDGLVRILIFLVRTRLRTSFRPILHKLVTWPYLCISDKCMSGHLLREYIVDRTDTTYNGMELLGWWKVSKYLSKVSRLFSVFQLPKLNINLYFFYCKCLFGLKA